MRIIEDPVQETFLFLKSYVFLRQIYSENGSCHVKVSSYFFNKWNRLLAWHLHRSCFESNFCCTQSDRLINFFATAITQLRTL
jgi:hypothetical protein